MIGGEGLVGGEAAGCVFTGLDTDGGGTAGLDPTTGGGLARVGATGGDDTAVRGGGAGGAAPQARLAQYA